MTYTLLALLVPRRLVVLVELLFIQLTALPHMLDVARLLRGVRRAFVLLKARRVDV